MPKQTVKIEGNDYEVVKIGNQYWLAKNYRKQNDPYSELLLWNDASEIAQKNDFLRLPTDADWMELKNWIKGKSPKESERFFLEKAPFNASYCGYNFTAQQKVMDKSKYAFFWSADDDGLSNQAHCWCLDKNEDKLYQATYPKTVKLAVRYLVDMDCYKKISNQ